MRVSTGVFMGKAVRNVATEVKLMAKDTEAAVTAQWTQLWAAFSTPRQGAHTPHRAARARNNSVWCRR